MGNREREKQRSFWGQRQISPHETTQLLLGIWASFVRDVRGNCGYR